MNKPFHEEELLTVLFNLLEIRKNLQAKYSSWIKKDSQSSLPDPDDIFLQKLLKIVEDNIGNEILTPNLISFEIGMSRTNLYRKLKALTNLSLTFFIRRVRLQKASDLLLNTKKSISEISYAVGFSDPKYFSRVFTKEFDISPSEFRKRNTHLLQS